MTRSGSRKPSSLSESILHELNMYAVAAGVAGVGALALAQPAEAKIVYTKANHKIGPESSVYNLDLNHDGITDFTIVDSLGSQFAALSIQAPSGNSVVAQELVQRTLGASDLPAGAKIPGNKKFYPGNFIMAESESFRSTHGKSVFGSWVNVHGRYLGLKFRIKGRLHYGWARLNVSCADYKCTGLLTGYAYETIPNKPIIAGATEESGVDEANPATLNEPALQPASLGLLAMGSPALSVWRREESLGVVP